MIRRRLVVHGIVQGVGYRYACAREAQRLGVRGSVRNEPDGTVVVVAEGDASAVQSLVAWARQGPAHASVQRVDVVEEPPGDLTGFGVEP